MAGRISYYGGIVKDGLVLDLDAAKKDSYAGRGTVWNDLSGNNNSGSLINGPTFNSDNGGSIVFDAVDDYATGFTSFTNIDNWSLCVWVYPTNVTNLQTVLQSSNYSIQIQSGFICYHYPNVFSPGVTTSSGITVNIWTNVVLLRENGTLKCYKNGQLGNGNITTSNPFPGSGQYTLAQYVPPTEPYRYSGRISNAQIYSKALSATEITQNYNAAKSRFGL
jgi:hypothetical protein